jgi:hypothetical protein
VIRDQDDLIGVSVCRYRAAACWVHKWVDWDGPMDIPAQRPQVKIAARVAAYATRN